MKKIIAGVFILLFTNNVFSQTAIIKGAVIDTVTKRPLQNAVIYLLGAKDSFLLQTARAGADGNFKIANVAPGKTILLISYPNYTEYTDLLDVGSSSVIDVKNIALISKSKLLQEVIIKAYARPIKINGDTTEYAADGFHIPPNATVEDLLKKLPGIRVNKNGQIFAQGEKVTLVLVDGEEFFSNDPALVTQNLGANVVDKVQVYDKKNDLGIVTDKTINLKLKEDKKNGYFGKLLYAQGTGGFFNRKMIYNNFKAKRKFAAYGIWSNTGKDGVNSGEAQDFEDASLSTANNIGQLDNWTGTYDGKGLPTLKTMAVHYDDKWNEDRQGVNTNYKIQQLNVNGTDSTITKYNLPDTIYYVKENAAYKNKILRNKITANYQVQLDSVTNIQAGVYAENTNKESRYDYTINSTAADNALLNTESRNQTANGKMNILNSRINFKRTIHNNKQAVIFELLQNFKTDNENGYLISDDKFYKNGNVTQALLTDQYKTNRNNINSLDARLTYRANLKIGGYVLTTINWVNVNSTSHADSYNKGTTGTYALLDSLYSNNFKFNTRLLKPQIGYTLITQKIVLISSLGIGKIIYRQEDHFKQQQLKSSYTNIFPRIDIRYNFKPRLYFSVNYLGSSSNPSLQQVQTNKTNLNPLNIVVGNPALKPSFNNYIGLFYFSGNTKKQRDITLRVKYNTITNDISSQSLVDSFGKTIYQYINTNGNHSFRESIEYDKVIKKLNAEVQVEAILRQSRYLSVVNNKINTNDNSTKEINIRLDKSFTYKVDAGIDCNINQTGSTSSLQKNKVKYVACNIAPRIQLHLPHKIDFFSDCNFIFNKTNSMFIKNQNAIVCNAWVEKTFYKNNDIQMRLSVNDILNKNIGFSVDANSNYLKQSGYNVIKRYALLAIVWNFKKGNINN